MKRDRDFEALGDGKKGKLDNSLESPHLVNSMQQQFLQQQHQYLQQQLQQLQQQQQQQQQIQQQPPTEQHWSIQGQIVPRPALPAHMLPYAMQSYLQGPYSQPSPFPRHQAPFPQYPTYHSDPNAHHLLSNSYLLHQQTADEQNFTNIPDHTPSPSPSPNPPLSPNVEEYQSSDAIDTASYEPSGAIPNEHSKVVNYSNQPFTPVEYPSPAQSPVEHPAEVVISHSRHPQDIDPYSIPISTEVDTSLRHPPAGVINSLNAFPPSTTPYTDVSGAESFNCVIRSYSSTVSNTAIDLSSSTTTSDGHPIIAAQAKSPSKVSSAYLNSHQSPVQGQSKEFGSNPVVLNSPQSMPHSPAGFLVPSSPYTSCLPNPPPNSPAVVSYVQPASDTIIKFQQYIDRVNTCASEKNVILNTKPVATKPSEDHTNITENISKSSENGDNKIHGSISVTKPVFQENLGENVSLDSSCSNGYIGAFAALIKSEDPEHGVYGNNMGNEESVNCEKEFNPLINQENEVKTDLGQIDLENISYSEKQQEKGMQHSNENGYKIYCTESKDGEIELAKKKPFTFSPFLYKYLNNEQKEDGIETLDWCSQMCTPPESPSATNSSTPTSSPTATAAPVPLITLTPCASYLYTSDENCSAVSELRDEQGILCQGGDILMRTADGSLRIIGSPVKFDDTAITGGSMSPSYQIESPTHSTAHLPISAASSPGSDILGDIMAQVGLVGVSAEEDMCLDEEVIGVMEEKGPSPSFVGEAQEMGYCQQRQFACHLCHCVYHDAWNLQVHMVSHPTPTPRPRRRSKTSVSSPENSSLYAQDYSEFIPPHLTPSLPKGTKFRRGGRRAVNKENSSPQKNPNGKYFCPECNIGYPSQGHMKRHMESHGANRKFSCDMCTASYSRRDNLDKHRNQHLMN